MRALVLVGEQPGDQEDLAGKPFVGPAGQLLDQALDEAGIDRETVYVTNAVKHFKFEPRGKRRIHSKPNAAEIKICSRTGWRANSRRSSPIWWWRWAQPRHRPVGKAVAVQRCAAMSWNGPMAGAA